MKRSHTLAACLLTALVSVPAYSSVIGTTGQVTIISPPADARVNSVLESNTIAPFFTELTNLLLGSNVVVDFTATGPENANPVGPLPNILAGTAVDSYYLVSDPVGSDANNNQNFSGSITFSTNILGVIVLDPEFASSNSTLGHPGTLYSPSGIQLEMGAPDNFTISADRRTFSFAFSSNTAADDVRIVTAASSPEPSTFMLALMAGAALLIAKARFRNPASRSGR